jgi:hypothetical protein
MRLLELFDKQVPYKLSQQSEHEYLAEFTVGEVEYAVFMEAYPVRQYLNPEFSKTVGNDNAYEAEMQVFQNSTPRDTVLSVEFIGKSKDIRYGTTKILGTGNQFLVFSTIVKIIQEVASKTRPKWIMFSAEEQSRIKLYHRMIKTLTKNEPLTYRGGYGGEPELNFIARL